MDNVAQAKDALVGAFQAVILAFIFEAIRMRHVGSWLESQVDFLSITATLGRREVDSLRHRVAATWRFYHRVVVRASRLACFLAANSKPSC